MPDGLGALYSYEILIAEELDEIATAVLGSIAVDVGVAATTAADAEAGADAEANAAAAMQAGLVDASGSAVAGADAAASASFSDALPADEGAAPPSLLLAAGIPYIPSPNESGATTTGYWIANGQVYVISGKTIDLFMGPLTPDMQQAVDASIPRVSSPSSPVGMAPTTPPPNDQLLNAAMQEAVGPYDPTEAASTDIREVLAGSDWAAYLSPQYTMSSLNLSLTPLPSTPSTSQQTLVYQIMSGTYASNILETQLANQGQSAGGFTSPTLPYDLLFSPNATSLAQAQLLASRTPNQPLIDAALLQYSVSMLPIVGSISTWMHPESGPFAKGVAVATGVLSVLPFASALSKELGALSPELQSSLSQIESETASLAPELEEGADLIPQAGQRAATIAGDELGALGEPMSNERFRRLVTMMIGQPGHPLRKLLNAQGELVNTTARGMSMRIWFEYPALVESGHLASAKMLGGVPGRLVLMTAYENRLLAYYLEAARIGGYMESAGTVLSIGGVPVEVRSAKALVYAGKLLLEDFLNAPRVLY
jgi:hypothetical protein